MHINISISLSTIFDTFFVTTNIHGGTYDL